MRVRWKVGTAFLAVVLASCGGGGGGDVPVPIAEETAGTTVTSSINSAETGISYDLKIWLPPSYVEETATYPVVYAMDCEYRFETLKAVMQRISTKAILVNVCAMGSARRWVDFTLPGATLYYRFLTRELIPSMDARYRTNPGNRSLSGHSLSAQFALYALYMEDPASRYFKSIVSEDCTCWGSASMNISPGLAPTAMEQAMYNATRRLPINLVVAQDSSSLQQGSSLAYDAIVSRGYQDLRSIRLTSYNLGHVPMDGPAFSDALNFIFSAP